MIYYLTRHVKHPFQIACFDESKSHMRYTFLDTG